MAIDISEFTDVSGGFGRGVGSSALDIADEETPHTHLGRAETIEIIKAAVSGLTATHRRVIVLRYQEGLTFVEIGEKLGVSESAVFQMHTRAIQRVKTSLALLGVDSRAALAA